MKLLGIAFFLLAVLSVCTVGVTAAVTTSASQSTTLQGSVLMTTAIRPTNESITSHSTSPAPHTTQQITQGTTTQTPVKVTTTAADKDGITTNTGKDVSPPGSSTASAIGPIRTATQASGTQLAQNESLDASSTTGWSSSSFSTTSLQNTTSAPGTSDFHVSTPTETTTSGSPGENKVPEDAIHYSSVILPIVITLIVITLFVFLLVALYRMCKKKTPERQENGTEQAQTDKEGVKLLSVKTTSPETVFVEVRDIYEVGFSLPSANLYEPTTPPPSGVVSQGRTAAFKPCR
ncbi:endomucin isoform X2 [Phalacrocorax aristotelis]|uniref:endomucin isoform X2 n=1 Tax=Phalacrocorax aristotelis TaxID=126867 RepID=UPI003F4BE58B